MTPGSSEQTPKGAYARYPSLIPSGPFVGKEQIHCCGEIDHVVIEGSIEAAHAKIKKARRQLGKKRGKRALTQLFGDNTWNVRDGLRRQLERIDDLMQTATIPQSCGEGETEAYANSHRGASAAMVMCAKDLEFAGVNRSGLIILRVPLHPNSVEYNASVIIHEFAHSLFGDNIDLYIKDHWLFFLLNELSDKYGYDVEGLSSRNAEHYAVLVSYLASDSNDLSEYSNRLVDSESDFFDPDPCSDSGKCYAPKDEDEGPVSAGEDYVGNYLPVTFSGADADRNEASKTDAELEVRLAVALAQYGILRLYRVTNSLRKSAAASVEAKEPFLRGSGSDSAAFEALWARLRESLAPELDTGLQVSQDEMKAILRVEGFTGEASDAASRRQLDWVQVGAGGPQPSGTVAWYIPDRQQLLVSSTFPSAPLWERVRLIAEAIARTIDNVDPSVYAQLAEFWTRWELGIPPA